MPWLNVCRRADRSDIKQDGPGRERVGGVFAERRFQAASVLNRTRRGIQNVHVLVEKDLQTERRHARKRDTRLRWCTTWAWRLPGVKYLLVSAGINPGIGFGLGADSGDEIDGAGCVLCEVRRGLPAPIESQGRA
ncbi:MAG: hypothetical protein WAN76_11560, partial [Candidatus Sulfotelmatobacter sp.]